MGFSDADGSFDAEKFFSPPLSCAPVYTWLWNAEITDQETDRQIKEMKRLGIRRFYILPLPTSFRPRKQPSMLTPEYLTPGYFAAYRHALERAKEEGMEVWLYDEGGWPSGGACGKVVESRPDLIRKTIRQKTRTLPKNTPYSPSKGTVIAFSGTEKVNIGQSFPKKRKITEYKETAQRFSGSAEIPDLTCKESAEEFLRITHERYLEEIGGYLGSTVTAVFCDEPTAPRPFAYRKELSEEFFGKYGIAIEEYFPYLFDPNKGGEKEKEVACLWYEFSARKFKENFLGCEREWANKHGMRFVGHLDKDDEVGGGLSGGSYDLMGAMTAFDVPGVDAIYRQIFPPRKDQPKGANGFFPRLASSAAAQTGGRDALTESFAVYGNGLTFEEMRYVLAFQAMRGVNVFNLMLFSYGRKGFLRTGELPHFAETHASFFHLATFNEYLARLSYLFSLGERTADVALYFPQRGLYAGEDGTSYLDAGKKLERKAIPFDVFTDGTMENADETPLDSGVLSVGRARYTVVVLPETKFVSESTLKLLKRFVRGGGKVLCAGKREEEGFIFDPELSTLRSPVCVEEGFQVATARLRDGKIVFIMNESAEKRRRKVDAEEGAIYADVTAGKLYRAPVADGKIELELCSGEVAALIYTTDTRAYEEIFVGENTTEITGWTVKKVERLALTREDITVKTCAGRVKKGLGDWRRKMGRRFSGCGEYRAYFTVPKKPTRAIIDFGEVRYTCEVCLNGIPVGVAVMPPYNLDVSGALVAGKNEIVVRVRNSAANEFRYAPTFLKYKKYSLTQYAEKERKFDKSSLKGGMIGPVKVRWK